MFLGPLVLVILGAMMENQIPTPFHGPSAQTVTVIYVDDAGQYGLREVTNVLSPQNLTTEDCKIPESCRLVCALVGENITLYWLTAGARGSLISAAGDDEPPDDDFVPTPDPEEGM